MKEYGNEVQLWQEKKVDVTNKIVKGIEFTTLNNTLQQQSYSEHSLQMPCF